MNKSTRLPKKKKSAHIIRLNAQYLEYNSIREYLHVLNTENLSKLNVLL